ncbi:MAG: ankyrin repeat domain-containing protein [Legionella sp.]|uniref:DUF5617 domain-containing protein n=1 Tax=Legionella sp. TaxID=459 RepID=UPI0039E418F0
MPKNSDTVPNTFNLVISSGPILFRLFYYLNLKHLLKFISANKKLHSFTDNAQLWSSILQQHFPLIKAQLLNYKIFVQIYNEEYVTLSKPQRDLFSQAKENDSILLETITAKDLQVKDNRGFTFLQWLSIKKNKQLLQKIYENASLKNSVLTNLGNTLPLYQPETISIDKIESFLKKPPSFKTLLLSELDWAIYCFQPLEIITTLREEQNFSEDQIANAFKHAAASSQLDIAEYLYDFVDPNVPYYDFFGKPQKIIDTVLIYAAQSGNLEVIRLLCEKKDYKPEVEIMKKVLQEATRYGNLTIIKFLYQHYKFDQASLGLILISATCYGHLSFVQYLFPLTTEYNSALYYAARDGHLNIIEYLCDNHKFSQETIKKSYTIACKNKRLNVVKYLHAPANNPKISFKVLNKLLEESPPNSPYVSYIKKEFSNELKNVHTPVSYDNLCNQFSFPMEKARALLNDYTKNNSALNRFFHGHWNRHHVHKVSMIVNDITNHIINTPQELLERLKAINPQNKTGSIARRTQYIEEIIFADSLSNTTSFHSLSLRA